MIFNRSSGILLHPTSLPGPDGIGDLGPEAYTWIKFLKDSGCTFWQILPLGPTGFGDSPYQCFSAFAGNPNLVSPALLLEQGLLTSDDFVERPEFNPDIIEYGKTIEWKTKILDRAFRNFNKSRSKKLKTSFQEFSSKQASWLEDFSLFMAIKESQYGVSWDNWPDPLRLREPKALKAFIDTNLKSIRKHAFRQFLFFKQWDALHDFARDNNISIIGDIPIFVAFDSSDAWANPDLFYFNEDIKPTVVAGVPPDYFSKTGQLWGNPLFKWDAHKSNQYFWWKNRIKMNLSMVDIIRIDHFRGFAGYWEIPAGLPTAEKGKWVTGPGADFFSEIEKELGDIPIIAEDLGEITEDVLVLRDTFNYPGMKILQFAFDADADHEFLPHNYPVNCVAYTGTHDNDTAKGWYESAPENEKDFCRRYLARSGEDISWDMIRAIWSSVAIMTLAPLQDFLGLDTTARMNFPGKVGGYWTWRFRHTSLSPYLSKRILAHNILYGRVNH